VPVEPLNDAASECARIGLLARQTVIELADSRPLIVKRKPIGSRPALVYRTQ
jgi:hypothetical protein